MSWNSMKSHARSVRDARSSVRDASKPSSRMNLRVINAINSFKSQSTVMSMRKARLTEIILYF